MTSTLWSLRSCPASIIKGCRLCFSSFHHYSYIKWCGHSPPQHLGDRRCPSIATGTCQCQQFYAGFCWGFHTNCSYNSVCATSITKKKKTKTKNALKTIFQLSHPRFINSRLFGVASMGKHWRLLQWAFVDAYPNVGQWMGGGGLSQGGLDVFILSLAGNIAGAYTAQYFAMTALGGSIQC